MIEKTKIVNDFIGDEKRSFTRRELKLVRHHMTYWLATRGALGLTVMEAYWIVIGELGL